MLQNVFAVPGESKIDIVFIVFKTSIAKTSLFVTLFFLQRVHRPMPRGLSARYLKVYKVILHSLRFFIMHYVSIQRTKHSFVRLYFASFSCVLVEARRNSPDDMALSRFSVSKSQRDSNRNEIHLSSSHVRGKISMQAARIRTKQNRDGAPRPFARLSNQSATNEQHELACKTTSRGAPTRSPRRNPSPCKSIHFGLARVLAFARGIPSRGFNSTAGTSSRETKE